MKKLLTLTGLSIVLLLCACEKDKNIGEIHLSPNRVEVIPSDGKTASTAILMCQIGHDGKNCPGCVLSKGKMIHMDCMGDGHYCAFSAAVQLQQDGEFFTATTTDTFGLTDQDFFNMPSRSLFVEYDEKNNEVWLNIPAQLVYRDSVTLQFTLNGLYYSASAAYDND